MASSRIYPRVAILGARGIGRVHARIFRELGADVCAVLGSSEGSAAAAAAELATSMGARAKPFFEMERLLDESLDAVSICTPPRLHFAQMLAAFDRGLPVFCEKPLFWEDGTDLAGALNKLDVMEAHPNRRLFVNTSNAAFIDAVRARLPQKEPVTRFFFRFHTNGPYRGHGIAVDLMPHGLSLVLRLLGRRAMSSFRQKSMDTRYGCWFSYGQCEVEFDFQEGDGPTQFLFRVHEREFRRVQEGRDETYRVYLQDVEAGDLVPVEDPFRTYISEFLRSVRDETPPRVDQSSEAAENMRLMARALIP